ncbi:ZIP family metal transporter [Terriglobus aquaticus]|uniref:ZIP family metal transporter n=1 Tax=Terriglobus aquaticus TaxID=940139 RepID=A0ABW9KFV2_9BACT|nr:ZIP family metal transporter [Terriglobus aquaticus]
MAIPFELFLFPVLATLAGGLLAVRFRRWLHLLLALGAGLLLGAAFLDLLPEAIVLGSASGHPVSQVTMVALLSLLGFFALESVLDSLAARGDGRLPRVSAGHIGGAMLIFHSLRDGMAIGAAFAASHPAGYAVAVGIAAHDLGDGVNTVLLTTGGKKPRSVDYGFLLADAIAPFAGGLFALRWFSSVTSSVVMLAAAAGFFIQMAASDFLPEVRRSTASRTYVMLCVLSGVGLIYLANRLLLGVR